MDGGLARHQLEAWREDQRALRYWITLAKRRGEEILRQRKELEAQRRKIAELEARILHVAAR